MADPISDYFSGFNWHLLISGFDPTIDGQFSRFRILDSNGNVVSDYESDDSAQANLVRKYKTLNLVRGDVNYDGIVDINDALLLMNYVTMLSDLSDLQYYLVDCNQDGTVNIVDVASIRSFLPTTASSYELDTMIQSYYANQIGGSYYEN